MLPEKVEVYCRPCNVPVQGPGEGDGDRVFSCPACGASDTFDDIMEMVKEQISEKVADDLLGGFDKFGRGGFIQVKRDPRPQKTYKFIAVEA